MPFLASIMALLAAWFGYNTHAHESDEPDEPNDESDSNGKDENLQIVHRTSETQADDSFDIQISSYMDLDESLLNALTQAADRLADLVIGMNKKGPDLEILIENANFSGSDTLAHGEFTNLNTTTSLPSSGKILIDPEKLDLLSNPDELTNLMMHEMMHIMGFGTLWETHGLVKDGEYTGHYGLEAYRDITNPYKTGIPIEEEGDAHTIHIHWDEEILGTEAMTGHWDTHTYFAPYSIASLADLGYQVRGTNAPLENTGGAVLGDGLLDSDYQVEDMLDENEPEQDAATLLQNSFFF